MTIVLCVTGSVAAVETVKLARELKRKGFMVKCFMTDGACDIINPYALEFATGEKVVTKLTGDIEHVKYADEDLILVAPATANVISKFAYKIADNPINTLLLTASGYNTPIVMVPSMHQSMYQAVEENIQKLKNEGVVFMEPREEENKAKFPSVDDVVLQAQKATSAGGLEGRNVLVSAGGTYESIDPIRGITNRSSGKMGLEMAKEAFRRGAQVTMITGRVEVEIPKVFQHIKVISSKDMQEALEENLLDHDVFIATAAVSDFTVDESASKISSSRGETLKLKVAPKIINQAKEHNPAVYLVGFKAEYGVSQDKLVESAKGRMRESGADLMVANDVAEAGAGFGSDQNKVVLVDDEVWDVPLSTKEEISALVIGRIIERII
ncbi:MULTISPECIES: bifunctional phosphopantothenoylcysteine decarboxylase/phosphopantothenate--cysteine ligase CoaBC [Methanobacterium]|jgi:phosphopantothenoylcysteine decarboxylase/phosphopantothenate--cysteine ligase|uniref:Coenzyme A biosynthesis bifunctional protein CoaBC n=1 Tax=Methanobacterium subterraneum TaxID=59277 RepID=A0A2H4VBS0_9EURY|nr:MULTISPECIES: bifunctional phosphopantothenoylcysteine decarboxylase/phosphopantothenate--cysteine ligase CoaBC [Methanobacterium]MBW4258402.1 bifunctional phosphopantothenoylcysteine decarboxylase/phosphopantothenate--cysteine ligase CoaBC [Methanobacterium sp. YSL]PKL71926.1 MAG: bifunctional phosphopantothenoylcysteine decarboxylase/phosphopantothenate--cysteine ligase CoaBC [Methanobacteriales archaeon HGW-Methanobacteriales-2]AUB55538.1 bifunctional phosphopantothenoylcysteine decarboxyl